MAADEQPPRDKAQSRLVIPNPLQRWGICFSSRTDIRSGGSMFGSFGTLRLRSVQAPEAVPFHEP